MNPELILNSADRLRLPSSQSSASIYGLQANDVVRRNLGGYSEIRSETAPASPPSLEERVFNALADAKLWTSKVAMHMDITTRDRYFRQLDLLHDCDEWFGDDKPMSLASYQGFIRFMLMIGGKSKPSLGLAPNGYLSAIWQFETDRLTIEFKDRNHVQWVVSKRQGDEIDRTAGSTNLERLKANLAPYRPEAWFGVE